LGWPQATFASKLEVTSPQEIRVTREVDGGLETLTLTLPALVTTDLRLNEPRYAKLPDIMRAKSKPLAVLELSSLGIDTTPRLELLNLSDPPKRKGGIKVSSVDELIDKLKNEAKII
jgi:electron transfer flavoprotein beta subunit